MFALAIQLGQSPIQRVRNPTRVIGQQHQDWSIGVLKVVVAKRSRGLYIKVGIRMVTATNWIGVFF